MNIQAQLDIRPVKWIDEVLEVALQRMPVPGAEAKAVDKDKTYTLKEAIDLAQKTSPVKSDATVEMHLRLGVDPRHAGQNIRDNLVFPAGTGKAVRVAVFAEADDAATAKKAGADLTDAEQLIKELYPNNKSEVISVNTSATRGRFSRRKRHGRMPKDGKKAIVTIGGDPLELFEA